MCILNLFHEDELYTTTTVLTCYSKCGIRVVKKNWKQNSGDWFLHRNNVGTHFSLSLHGFMSKNKMTVISHPPYSPDIVPSDFSFFPEIKMVLKGRRCNDIAMMNFRVLNNVHHKMFWMVSLGLLHKSHWFPFHFL